MNDLLNVLLFYLLGFPFSFSDTGGYHAGGLDEVRHAEDLAETTIWTSAPFMFDLIQVLLLFLFGFPLPCSGTGATAPGA